MSRYTDALDRVGRYLADCADASDDEALVEPCPRHPVYASDLWTLYCAHRENGNTRPPLTGGSTPETIKAVDGSAPSEQSS